MRHRRHQRFALALELVLVAMRLSCEGFFVLMATYAAYLLRGPPRLLAAVIRAMSALSLTLQGALSIFPAVCWAYGAGLFFSTFVSLVFWGAPAWAAYEFIADNLFAVIPVGVRRAGRAMQERAGPQCVICWGAFTDDATASVGGSSDAGSDGGGGPWGGACRGCSGRSGGADTGSAPGDQLPGAHDTDSVDSAEAQAWGGDLATAAQEEGAVSGGRAAAGAGMPRRRRRRWFPFGRRKAADDESEDEVVSRPLPADGLMSPRRSSGDSHALDTVGDTPSTPTSSGVAHAAPSGAPPASPDWASGSDAGDLHGELEDDVTGVRGLRDRDVVVTECRHVFHYGCLSNWLQQCMVGMRSTACPLCQRHIEVDIQLDVLGMLQRLRQHLWRPLRDGGGGGDADGAAGEDEVRLLYPARQPMRCSVSLMKTANSQCTRLVAHTLAFETLDGAPGFALGGVLVQSLYAPNRESAAVVPFLCFGCEMCVAPSTRNPPQRGRVQSGHGGPLSCGMYERCSGYGLAAVPLGPPGVSNL